MSDPAASNASRSAISKTVLQSAQPLPVTSPLTAYPPCSFDCDIYDGSSPSQRPCLTISQQDSEDLRSERERRDETGHRCEEPRTERYLEPARVDRFCTSLLTRAGLNALVEPWMWMSWILVVDFGTGRDVT
jgi:hypothetical protein